MPVFLLTTPSSIGWVAVDTVCAVIALQTWVPVSFWAAAAGMLGLQIALAAWGHNAVHTINVIMTIVVGVLFAALTTIALHGGHVHSPATLVRRCTSARSRDR